MVIIIIVILMGKKKPSKSKDTDVIELTMDELIKKVGIREEDKGGMATQIDAIYEDRGFIENLSDNCPRDTIEQEFRQENGIDEDEPLTPDQEQEINEKQGQCEQDKQDEIHNAIRNSVETVAEEVFEDVGLSVNIDDDKYLKNIDSKAVTITPTKDWEDAAHELWKVADCFGMGDAMSFKEYKEQEGKSDKELVKDLLHWGKNHAECYGTRKHPTTLFDEALESQLR